MTVSVKCRRALVGGPCTKVGLMLDFACYIRLMAVSTTFLTANWNDSSQPPPRSLSNSYFCELLQILISPLAVVQWNKLPDDAVKLPTLPQFSVAVRSLDPRQKKKNLFSPVFKPHLLVTSNTFICFSISLLHFLYPATQKVAGYYVIPSELWVSVRPSVRPSSVRLSVRPSVCPSALRFRALTLVPFDLFSSNFA